MLLKHNHTELEKEIEKYTLNILSRNSEGLLGMFTEYYNNFRYANYVPGRHDGGVRKLFIGFLRKQNGKFDFDAPYALAQFEDFKRFYINEVGSLHVIIMS